MGLIQRWWRLAQGQYVRPRGSHYYHDPAGFNRRRRLIVRERLKGRTLASIGAECGISSSRVEAILKEVKLRGLDRRGRYQKPPVTG